jgi:hypothetical protein
MRALVILLAILTLHIEPADACSCVERSLAQHAKTEKLVVIARAGKPEKTGDALKQTFTVLATLKGKAAPTFVLDRPATPPCKQDYAEGEVAVLFTSGGDLDPCHGNLPLASQINDLPSIADAAGVKRGAAKLEPVEVALREALGRYLHDRPNITVAAVGFPGKSIQIGKSKLTFAANPKFRDLALSTFTIGDIAYVSGTYATEGVRYSVLLHFDKTWKVVGSSVAEK